MRAARVRRRARRPRVALLFLCWLAIVGLAAVAAGDDPPLYATTPFLEPDRCATAWVVSRYVHPNAVFEFHPREALPQGAILIDLPEAELKRDARRAAVEALVAKEKIEDPFVTELARLVHDIEINAWARRDYAKSGALESLLMQSMDEADSPEAKLGVCFALLDRLRQLGGDVDAWVEALEREAEARTPATPGTQHEPESGR